MRRERWSNLCKLPTSSSLCSRSARLRSRSARLRSPHRSVPRSPRAQRLLAAPPAWPPVEEVVNASCRSIDRVPDRSCDCGCGLLGPWAGGFAKERLERTNFNLKFTLSSDHGHRFVTNLWSALARNCHDLGSGGAHVCGGSSIISASQRDG